MPFLVLGASGFCIEKCSLHRQRREGRETKNISIYSNPKYPLCAENLPLQRLLLFPDRYAPSFSRKLFSSFTDHSSFDSSSTGSTAIDGKPLDTLSSISKTEKYSVSPCSTTDTLHKNRRGCPVSDHVTVIVQRVYWELVAWHEGNMDAVNGISVFDHFVVGLIYSPPTV